MADNIHPPLLASEAALRLDHQLCFALYSASLAMTKVYKPLLSDLGLTYPQYLVLLVLWEQDGLPVSELGERLFLDSGTLTPLLKRMEGAGWVKRQRSTQDERRVHVWLTTTGQSLQHQAACIPGQLVGAIGCALPELAHITHAVQGLRDRLLERLAGGAAHPGTDSKESAPATDAAP